MSQRSECVPPLLKVITLQPWKGAEIMTVGFIKERMENELQTQMDGRHRKQGRLGDGIKARPVKK